MGFLASRFVAPVGCSVLGSLWAGVGDVGVAGVSISSLVECVGISCSSMSGNKSYSSRSKDQVDCLGLFVHSVQHGMAVDIFHI